jgi:hypothetical protein
VKNWLQAVVLALVFIVVGAFTASLWLEVRRETPATIQPPPGRWEGRRIRVEVLNGGEQHGAAREVGDHLRDLEFDVVHYGNADESRDSSVVIARLDTVEPARRVADALGLGVVLQQPDRNLYLDVTVILGADWLGPVESGVDEAGQAGIWWSRIKRAARRLWPG